MNMILVRDLSCHQCDCTTVKPDVCKKTHPVFPCRVQWRRATSTRTMVASKQKQSLEFIFIMHNEDVKFFFCCTNCIISWISTHMSARCLLKTALSGEHFCLRFHSHRQQELWSDRQRRLYSPRLQASASSEWRTARSERFLLCVMDFVVITIKSMTIWLNLL